MISLANFICKIVLSPDKEQPVLFEVMVHYQKRFHEIWNKSVLKSWCSSERHWIWLCRKISDSHCVRTAKSKHFRTLVPHEVFPSWYNFSFWYVNTVLRPTINLLWAADTSSIEFHLQNEKQICHPYLNSTISFSELVEKAGFGAVANYMVCYIRVIPSFRDIYIGSFGNIIGYG